MLERGWLSPGLVGYALLWDDVARGRGSSEVRFARGAFDEFLRRRPFIPCWIDHDGAQRIGATSDGSFIVRSDATGLRIELTPYDTVVGRRLMDVARQRGRLGASISWWRRKSVIVRRGNQDTVFASALAEISVCVDKPPSFKRSWVHLWTPDAQQRLVDAHLAGYESELEELEQDL